MTASVAFKTKVMEAIRGDNRAGSLRFLRNYKKGLDGAAVTGIGTVSTKLHIDTATLAASASVNVDLAGGAVDLSGVAQTFTKIHAIYLKASASNTNDVVIGAAASNDFIGPWSTDGTTAVSPGATFLVESVAGWTVTAATGDILKIANSAGTTGVTYDLVIVGE